jgi:hypothetical protein
LKRLVVAVIACVVAVAAAGSARAHHWVPGACGLPTTLPLEVEYAEVSVSPRILDEIFGPARPPLVLATGGTALPQHLRALGAHTVYWQMKIERMLGGTATPADPSTIDAAADRLYERAVAATDCSTPSIALNELQGNWLPTPWQPSYAQYRANALELVRRLHALGAHPYLMVTTSPPTFTESPEAAEWWREAAQVSDIVLQVHFDARYVYARGPLLSSRARRMKMRRVLDQFTALGIPPERLGLLHGFQSGRGFGGREGLRLDKWLRVVKWEVLATRQVLAERAGAGVQIGSDWSWGWGDYPALSRVDPDKPVTACVYLWARDPTLCDGPALAESWGVAFDTSLTEGQILLPPGTQCEFGSRRRQFISGETLVALAAVDVGGRPLGRRAALSTLFQWLVDSRNASVRPEEVRAAEDGVIARRFGGSRAAYERALAERSFPLALAHALLADELRRAKITRRLAPGRTFTSWAVARQARVLETATCVQDELPAPTAFQLTVHFPFLALARGR